MNAKTISGVVVHEVPTGLGTPYEDKGGLRTLEEDHLVDTGEKLVYPLRTQIKSSRV